MPITVRPASVADAADLAELSRAAILRSAAGHYGGPALRAWADRRTTAAHRRMVERTTAYVATDGEAVLGFATLAVTPVDDLVAGEVDQLFVHPDAGGRGVARLLLSTVEDTARAAGLAELVSHVSWRAAPVFARAGFEQVEVETVRLGDEELTRARMRKRL